MVDIIHFTGSNCEHGYLSNFYPSYFLYKGWECYTSEHAYQAEKTLIRAQQQEILAAGTPGRAKQLGKKVLLRADWIQVRDQIMLDVCLQKFLQNSDISARLIATGDALLVEHTPWKDSYWGDNGDGTGKNRLGFILQAVRAALVLLEKG